MCTRACVCSSGDSGGGVRAGGWARGLLVVSWRVVPGRVASLTRAVVVLQYDGARSRPHEGPSSVMAAEAENERLDADNRELDDKIIATRNMISALHEKAASVRPRWRACCLVRCCATSTCSSFLTVGSSARPGARAVGVCRGGGFPAQQGGHCAGRCKCSPRVALPDALPPRHSSQQFLGRSRPHLACAARRWWEASNGKRNSSKLGPGTPSRQPSSPSGSWQPSWSGSRSDRPLTRQPPTRGPRPEATRALTGSPSSMCHVARPPRRPGRPESRPVLRSSRCERSL